MNKQSIPHLTITMQSLFHSWNKHFFCFLKTNLFVLCLLGLLVAACSQTPPTPTRVKEGTLTAIVEASLTSSVSIKTPTPDSSPTPAQSMVILVAPSGSDQALVAGLKTVLDEKAASSGLSLLVKETLTASDLHPGVRLVVALPPDSGLAAMALVNSQIQFVAVEIDGLQPTPNLSLVGASGGGLDQQAFLAGYLAAMVTPDWRVGVINPADDNLGPLIRDAFKNGARYFCGLCKPAYPPFVIYPQAMPLDNPSDQASWQVAADNLLGKSVQTVYVPPLLSSPELLDYLDRAKVNLIGAQIPSGLKVGHWLASIRPDPALALAQLWLDLMAGKGGASLALPLVVEDADNSQLSVGKMRLIQEMIVNLAQERINPDPVPEP